MKKLLLCYFAFVAIILLSSCLKAPSDDEMINNFHKHKATFLELVKMMKHDKGVNCISLDEKGKNINPNKNITKDREILYKKLLSKANLTNINCHTNLRNIINFGYYYYDDFKEYVYRETQPKLIIQNTGKYHSKNNVDVYRCINGNWYIHYFE